MEKQKLKVLELFSGYGTSSFALKRLGIPYEIIGYSDIDKYANQCFKQNHSGKELGDIKNINPNDLEDFDLLTAGFPCQSFSVAGCMKGESDSRGTLFYEIIRIAEVKQPKFMLLENVKGLTCRKFKPTFNKILSELRRIGYNVYWKVLNSKNYGIPQSRERIWFVCFRRDIDVPMRFQFPEPRKLKIFIKDILESQVDKKYYLSPLLQERFIKYLEEKNDKIGTEEPAILDLYNHKVKDDGTSITISNPCHNNLRLIEGENKIVAPCLNPNDLRKGYSGQNKKFLETIASNFYVQEKEINGVLYDNNENIDEDIVVYTRRTGDLSKVYQYAKERYEQTKNPIQIDIYHLLYGELRPITTYITENESFSRCLQSGEPKELIYYPSEEPIIYDRKGFDSKTKGFRENELSPTLSTKMGTGGNNVPMVLGNLYDKCGEMGNIYSTEKISPTITGYHKGDSLKIMENNTSVALRNKNRSKHQVLGLPYGEFPKDYVYQPNKEEGISFAVKSSPQEFMVAISNASKREIDFKKDISPTLLSRDYKDPKIVSNTITTAVGKIGHSSEELGYINNNMRCGQLRRLTPKECFRLMGFLNDEINLDSLSDTQKYKLAGNGQDVNIVSLILEKILQPYLEQQKLKSV